MEGLKHCPTGIDGLDKVTAGLVRGNERGEPGVLVAFE